MTTPFSRLVGDGLQRTGLTLRQLCRLVELDPSFFSKVLAGKRSPPSEEDVLRRIAGELGLDAPELIVSAGRIPSEWAKVSSDPELFRRVHSVASGASVAAPARPSAAKAPARVAAPPRPSPTSALSEELL